MNCNVKWNGEMIKRDEINIFLIFECEWKSPYLCGENDDWLSEKFAGKNIWNRRKRCTALRYGDCVLTADCVRGIG